MGGGTDPQFFVVQWVRILLKYVKNSIFWPKKIWGGVPPTPQIATDTMSSIRVTSRIRLAEFRM